MDEKKLVNQMLHELAEILEKLRKHNKPLADISDEELARLKLLEETIAVFNELNQKALKAAHIDIEQMRKETVASPHLSEKDKRFFEQVKKLERDAQNLQIHLQETLNEKENEGRRAQDQEKKQKKNRIKKFKGLGGYRGWIRD